MSSGELTNILVSTDVTRYLEFRQVAGSYVQQGSGAKATVAKVPSDAGEALRSSLMGLFEKRRMKSFIEWVGTFNEADSASHKGRFSHSKIALIADRFRSQYQPMHHEGCL
jgi:Rab GDP dissociation inhibitor